MIVLSGINPINNWAVSSRDFNIDGQTYGEFDGKNPGQQKLYTPFGLYRITKILAEIEIRKGNACPR